MHQGGGGFHNPFVIGIVRPRVRLAPDYLGCNVPVRRPTTRSASTNFNQKRRPRTSDNQRHVFPAVSSPHCWFHPSPVEQIMPVVSTSERKQKRKSATEARSSSTKNRPPFLPVTAREMAETEGRVASPSDDRYESGVRRDPTRDGLEVDACGLSLSGSS